MDANVPTGQMNQGCPLCGRDAFAPAGQVLDLNQVLKRWEAEAGVEFGPEVWEQYSDSAFWEVSLYQCGHCGFSRFQPEAPGTAEFYGAVEDGNYYVADRWEMAQAVKDLRRHRASRILDIGCGSGHFLGQMKRDIPGSEPMGHELAPDSAAIARKAGFRVESSPLGDLAACWGSERFEAVTALQVLEHLPDPVEFLAQVSAILQPGGVIIIGVPDAGGPVANFQNALTDIPPHHLTRWREESFSLGLASRGYRILRTAKEPLPHFLWDFYLPVMWDQGIWPARLGRFSKGKTNAEQAAWFVKIARKLKLRHLWGVPGHTLYAVLRPEEAQCAA